MGKAKIYIYGVIDNWQDPDSDSYGYVNLSGVKKQLENQKNYDEIEVHIHSEGGVVTEGFAIHDYIRSQGLPVTTIIDGVCASIATVVLLAGDVRVGTENAKPFIHNPWGMAGGDKEELRKYADDLEAIENDIAEFYAKKTSLTKDNALELMRNDTTFTAEEALANGLLTKIETVMRAVALLNKTKNNKMAKEELTKEHVDGMFAKVIDRIKNFGKSEPAQNKTVTDATGDKEIVFPDLEDDATPTVGDKATIDGAAAEGEVLMPSGETYKFEAGVLTEVVEKEEGEGEDDVEALKAENEDLKKQLSDAQALADENAAKAKDRKKEIKALNKSVEEIGESVKKLKKDLGSNFNYKSDKDNFEDDAPKTRQVFKKVDAE